MAESTLESFLTCSVCLDVLTEPVSLSCHHSFCKRCLQEHWAQQPSRPCPVCRRRSSKDALDINFALKELSISFRQKHTTQDRPRQEETTPSPGETTAPGQGEPEKLTAQAQQWSVCPAHPQVPPLFCLDDLRPLCSLCEFSLHPQHTVVSGEEAEKRLKELISSQLQALTEEKHKCEELQQNYENIQQFSEKQAAHCEGHIKTLFSRLHEFLQKEEERSLSSLREEQLRQRQNMGPELEKVLEKLSSVDKSIQELQQQLETHIYRPQQEGTSIHLRPKAGLLLDQAKVLGNMGFRVWVRMKKQVKYQPVVLDPNTASLRLLLSEDLSAVRNTESTNEELPDVPERFCNYPIVLGSVGYSSGTHQWDVEVGDHPHWVLGVTKESIERKKEWEDSFGNQTLCFCNNKGQYKNTQGPVKVKKSPEKIRVKLDFNAGTLSFSDADKMKPLCTITLPKVMSSETLFPLFCIISAGGAKTKEVRICDVQSEESHSMDVPLFF